MRGVIVTGAGGGMGRAIAEAFAKAGDEVLVADLNEAGLAQTVAGIEAAGGRAIAQRANVTQEADVAALVETAKQRFGRLDVMVNNAAILGPWLPIHEQSAEALDAVLGVNVKGVVFGMKHALLAMRAAGRGAIVNIASVQGVRVVYPGAAFYAASKSAVVALTRAAALENGSSNIRVNAIAPGPIDTPMLRAAAGDAWPPAIVSDVPLGRLGMPEDIAKAVFWLAGDEAAYVSGALLAVDGGFLAP